MPVVHPADIWRESGRYDADRTRDGPVQGPRRPRHGPRDDPRGGRRRPAARHRQVLSPAAGQLYHFQTKFRDEPRSRGGLIRVREFTMKDAYSCDLDDAGLDVSYQAQYGAYARIFERLGLDTIAVASDVGMMGGTGAHEFMLLNPAGEDTLVLCEKCGYAANQQIADGRGRSRRRREPLPTEEVATPGTATIADLAAFLRHRRLPRPPRRSSSWPTTAGWSRRSSAATTRSTRPSSPTPSRAATSGRRARRRSARPAWSPDMRRRSERTARSWSSTTSRRARRTSWPARTAPGSTCATSTSGATSRPTSSPTSRTRREGDPCPNCGSPVVLRNGIEVGNIFKLGTKYTEALGRDATSARTARSTRSSWARTGSASGGTWPASSRPITTRRGSSGRRRSRRMPRTSSTVGANRDPRVDRGRRGAARAFDRGRERDPLRRPRRVAGRQVHRRGAARDAVDPDGQSAQPGGGGHRGHGPGDGREVGPARSRRSRPG